MHRAGAFPVPVGVAPRRFVRGTAVAVLGNLGADGNRLVTEFHFGLTYDDRGWQDVSVEGHVPEDAVEQARKKK